MSTDRLFMTSPAIDGRDDIEDYWLKNRDYVLSIPQVPRYISYITRYMDFTERKINKEGFIIDGEI